MSAPRGGAAMRDGAGLVLHEMSPIERLVSRVLGAGIAVAVALMLAGIVLGLARGDGLPSRTAPPGDLPALLAALDPSAYLSLGLMVLILTPFLRVAGSVVLFARARDRRYVLVTAAVLAVMAASVLLGRA